MVQYWILKWTSVVLFLWVVTALMLSPLLLAAEGERDPVEAGRTIAVSICAECHAVAPEGDSPFEPAPPFRDVIKKWPIESLAESLAEGIVVGHKAMPEFQFEGEALTDLLAYLSWLRAETAEE